MDPIAYLVVPLLQRFEWFDEGLQSSMQARGWPTLTAPESMVVVHVIVDIVRPSDIARSIGLTRQAIHITLNQIIKKGLLELRDDPSDRRGKIVTFTNLGKAMRRDAQMVVKYCAEQLAARIGGEQIEALAGAFAKEWGAPVTCPVQAHERDAVRRRLRERRASTKPVDERPKTGQARLRGPARVKRASA